MRIAFIMDPIETLALHKDTTVVLMREAHRRGHEIFSVTPENISIDRTQVEFHGRPVSFGEAENALPEALIEIAFQGADCDAVLVRTDPPFDESYLQVTWALDFLPQRVFVMNSPQGLRNANEKLAALHFPDLTPPTLVTRRLEELLTFMEGVGGAMVVKPINAFGGKGVMVLRRADKNLRAVLSLLTEEHTVPIIAQAYLPEVKAGDKRIIVLNGKPVGAVLRVASPTDNRSNVMAGGSVEKAEITERDRQICERIAPFLEREGLFFAGIDVIGGLLTEINVTSPTCVQEINRLSHVKLEQQILDFLEAKVGERIHA
ncbi:MAG: glutathione synthase [Candidatus Omnitrophica bacterium]|nr:glutathione synthase [Candidatus Omnitrophota bacterium]